MGNHYDPRDDETEVECARREGREEAEHKQRMMPTPNLRDQFAMAALTGLLMRGAHDHDKRDGHRYYELSYEIADGMLEARKPKP